MENPQVLLVEDTESLAEIYKEYLREEPIQLLHTSTGAEAKELIQTHSPLLIILDLKLPDMDGQEILQWIQHQQLPTEVVVITAHSSVDIAVDVMRDGAIDFLQKPFDGSRFRTTVRNALEQSQLKHWVDELQNTFDRHHYHGFIGGSLPMQAVYRIIDAAAPSSATIFITGESGTGKEVCAEAIHKQGPRAKQPFIPLNCGAIPKDLMESEIFGQIKGAFTGALTERKGAATLADGGTLFLDEIGEMDLDLQTKLLRFVQAGTFQKVGSSKVETVDVRFICATNRNPLDEVAAGRFREDLFYRLHVVPLHLPPLHDRGDDILQIASHFLGCYAEEENKSFRSFSPEVEVILRSYSWPGNVRQLQNVIRNIMVLHNGDTVTISHLPPPLDTSLSEQELTRMIPVTAPSADQASPQAVAVQPLAVVEREAIEQAIALCNDNIPKAAALLEVSPSTIYRKKQAWESH
ncbi:MAG: sigma-54-dependent Fis family transcriptional regulator [Gammaproteobacteria bacterium]|jgi:DNA-binding NtrC family response regulator|nr:sigma-54-dependent Fis family transcriptional regulator [Gammaproteobacteria bacterium]MBT4607024.1 sigma-54-dependent Fis family transcriptional regulator [Thiotrichales bacterium]MBT3471297.1 sigma-54-dependent Fis family transcriptional regulator [Gammaproteobacteria bacterium]MBT3968662.1 sigma-54-dependent Fis family transcriptional regulator [Gammaproteobacteria bacterium]MBT4080268.1 sigma-54-dependent Fis family transcriptional regulator [Gammaproteobacteria bacterium]